MYIHIFHDDTFVDEFIELSRKLDTPCEYWVDTLKPEAKFVTRHDRTVNLAQLSDELSRQLDAADKIFIHWLSDKAIAVFCAARFAAKKLYWVIWGGDLYRWLKIDLIPLRDYQHGGRFSRPLNVAYYLYQTLQNRWAYWVKSRQKFAKLLDNLTAVLHYNQYDVNLLNRQYRRSVPRLHFFYKNIINWEELDAVMEREPPPDNVSLKVLLGNSATLSNNHFTALDRLKEAGLKNIEIHAPLSYGGDKYATVVEQYGKKLFGDRFVAIKRYMSPAAYSQVLWTMDAAIMNHARSQGMGVIILLLYLGKKLFLNPACTSYNFLGDLGVVLFTVDALEALELGELPDVSKECNKQKIKSFFSDENCLQNVATIIRLSSAIAIMAQSKPQGFLKLLFKFSLGPVVSAFISLFSTPVFTALLLPDEFGRASMYTLAFNLILQVVILGTDQGFIRKFYTQPDEGYQAKLLFNALVLPVCLSLLVSLVVLSFGSAISVTLIDQANGQFIVLLVVSIFIGLIERFAMLALRMQKRAGLFSTLRVVYAVVNFLVVYAYCHLVARDFFAIIYGNLIGLTVCAAFALVAGARLWRRAEFDWKLNKELIRYGLPFLPAFLAAWVFEGIDKITLRQYSTFAEIGLFTAAYKIVTLIAILQTAFTTFWAPVAFELYETGGEKARSTYTKVLSYGAAVFFLAGLGIILTKDIIIILFEKKYHEAAAIMPFLIFVPIMYTLSEVTVGGINFKNKTYWHSFISIFCAAINYGLNIALVPQFGAKGAAVSTGISFIAFFYARTFISNRLFPLAIDYRRLHVSMLLLVVPAYFNPFFPADAIAYLSAAASMIFIGVLFRKELFDLTIQGLRKAGLRAPLSEP